MNVSNNGGTLYGLGVGPGDPELITVKARRILGSVPVIAYPAPEQGDSLSRAIAAAHVPDGLIEIAIRTPMTPGNFPADDVYDRYASEIALHLKENRDVAVLCEGDPFLYGSFMYIFARLAGEYSFEVVPGVSSLGAVAADGMAAVGVTWMQAFVGSLPGSLGETSALACLIGAFVLIATGVGSWRIIVSMILSTIVFAELLHMIGSDTNPMFQMDASWHLVVGGFAFGCIFMATDPVSASMTETGRWFYGALIGFMTVLIRVINPAFPEGVMLAILFGNVFAPVIDHVVLQANIKRRLARTAVSS